MEYEIFVLLSGYASVNTIVDWFYLCFSTWFQVLCQYDSHQTGSGSCSVKYSGRTYFNKDTNRSVLSSNLKKNPSSSYLSIKLLEKATKCSKMCWDTHWNHDYFTCWGERPHFTALCDHDNDVMVTMTWWWQWHFTPLLESWRSAHPGAKLWS